MKFIIREKLSNKYFDEPGMGLTDRLHAHVFDTEHIWINKFIASTQIIYKKPMPHVGCTAFERNRFVVIPVGDL